MSRVHDNECFICLEDATDTSLRCEGCTVTIHAECLERDVQHRYGVLGYVTAYKCPIGHVMDTADRTRRHQHWQWFIVVLVACLVVGFALGEIHIRVKEKNKVDWHLDRVYRVPQWGKVELNTHVDGVVSVGNGGTGYTVGDMLYASGGTQKLTEVPYTVGEGFIVKNDDEASIQVGYLRSPGGTGPFIVTSPDGSGKKPRICPTCTELNYDCVPENHIHDTACPIVPQTCLIVSCANYCREIYGANASGLCHTALFTCVCTI